MKKSWTQAEIKKELKGWDYSAISKCPQCKLKTLVHYNEQGFLPQTIKCLNCGYTEDPEDQIEIEHDGKHYAFKGDKRVY